MPGATGMIQAPASENLLPSIAKLQIVFSLVSHPETNPWRLGRAPAAERANYANPMLIYEAVVTLHNPYDVAIKFDKLRFRVWNPPVGFRIAKISNGTTTWLRKEWQDDSNNFHGLGRFNRLGQGDTQKNNQRFFTLHLSDGKSDAAGNQLFLQPGEVKVFAARVEKDWRWGWEWGWKPRRPWQFLDWFDSADLAGAGNRDLRTVNKWGVEAVPGWDLRAGLQMNHLSMEGGGWTGQRPSASFYPFEDQKDWWVADPMIHFDDEVLVQMRPEKTTAASQPDTFRVDLLAAKVEDFSDFVNSRDVLRTYRFQFTDPTGEISAYPAKPVIERRFKIGDILQRFDDPGKGGKKPMAMLEMTARTTRDELDDSKAWVFNNPVVEGGAIFTGQVGLANQSHDLRLIELTGWSTFPTVEWDAADGEGTPGFGRGYFGASRTSSEGVTNVPMFRVPVAPATSLGDWIPANLVAGSLLPRVVHAFGNSRAHPLIPSASVFQPELNPASPNPNERDGLDHSYLLNDALWDRYYFSSLADAPALPWISGTARNWRDTLQALLEQRAPAPNLRITALRPTARADSLVASISSLGDKQRARELGATLRSRGRSMSTRHPSMPGARCCRRCATRPSPGGANFPCNSPARRPTRAWGCRSRGPTKPPGTPTCSGRSAGPDSGPSATTKSPNSRGKSSNKSASAANSTRLHRSRWRSSSTAALPAPESCTASPGCCKPPSTNPASTRMPTPWTPNGSTPPSLPTAAKPGSKHPKPWMASPGRARRAW